MPELPEVETIRRGLEKTILNKKIAGVEVKNKKAIRGGADNFVRTLKNNSIKKVGRVGKLLMFELADGNYMFAHMKMTGQLIYRFDHKVFAGGHNLPHFTETDLPTKYSRVIWSFNDGSKLYFNDMRKFGYLQIVDREKKEKTASAYGIEPLTKNFTVDNLKKVLAERKAPVKAVLINQQLVSGIGNIYADEICFEAKIKPDRPAGKLTEEEIKILHKSANKIIEKAIKYGGTTFKDYVNAHGAKGNFVEYLKVYKREKQKCLRCKKGIISVKRVAGRGTRFCPVCQK